MRGLLNQRKKWTYNLVAGSAVIALLLACRVETLRADGPNLAGTWKLNEKKSDDVRAKMMEARRSQNQDQSQGPDAGGPGGGDNGGREMRGGPGRGGMMADLSQLTIEQTATTAKVTGFSGPGVAVLGPAANPNASPDNSAAAPAHNASADDLPANSDA